MITFHEIDKSFIKEKHSQYFHDKARYFQIKSGNKNIGINGVIDRENKSCEVFLNPKMFKWEVLSKEFFNCLFNYLYSIGYNRIYTWTKWNRLSSIFSNFEKIGIERSNCPEWDNDSTKIWFVKKRI